ncbi:ATP-binding cassette domain-containing protein, partial [Enterobacter hormaechei]|uniref:ATP-binding cassette domain-containing protein n=1 Tax=Enterobacter hormaechei TaxID=158836 RepID=UPI0031343F8D
MSSQVVGSSSSMMEVSCASTIAIHARWRCPHQPLFTRWRKEDDEAVNRAMQATGITDLAQQSVDTLSGGQRQRAWIAMVLAQETSIMLLDEPT